MAQKKENLPVKVDVDLQNGGTISYANEVIATIAGVAANEIDGIAGMSVAGGIGEIWGKNKNITRGVKVEVSSHEASVDLYIIVEYGKPIQKVAAEVQENVRKALESLTGLKVVKVDVHVQGVSFEMEKKANENVLEAAKNPVLTEAEQPGEEDGAFSADEEEEEEADLNPASETEFDQATLDEEARLDGEDEPAPDQPEDPEGRGKKRPKGRLRA